jgi:glutaredoxin
MRDDASERTPGMTSGRKLVEIYSKADCHLCEEAKAVLERVRRRVPFELREIDIETDPTLRARYKYSIPVVAIDGRRAFRHRVDETKLEALLRR